jgi:hypothetical protein
LTRRDLLAKEHGEGIGLLARAAAGDPDSQGTIERLAEHEIGNDLVSEERENLRIAEKARDIDEQVLGEEVELVRVVAQKLEIAIHVVGVDRRHRHPSFDAALQRAGLVEREIMGGLRAQKIDDLAQPVLWLILGKRSVSGARDDPPTEFDERFRDFRDREHEVDRAGRHRAARHAVIIGLVRVLRDDEPAFFLHGFQPEAAVGPRSREDHADGARADIGRERMQQKVEGQPRAMARLGPREMQGAVLDGEIGAGRNDVEMLRLDRHSLRCLPHAHRRVAGQQIHHHALMGGIEMLNEDEGHAAVGRQGAYELPAGIEAAGRSAYADDGEVASISGRSLRGQGGPAR